jgi:head-tail adaptor
MSIKLREIIEISEKTTEKDSDGFAQAEYKVLKRIYAYREDRHANESWANRAAFSKSSVLFRFRKIPGLEITPKLFINCRGKTYNISSVEDIKNRSMYIEILCDLTEGSVK